DSDRCMMCLYHPSHLFTHSILVVFLLLLRRPARSPLFPYTTLFRSVDGASQRRLLRGEELHRHPGDGRGAPRRDLPQARPLDRRSEEHTSELQSRFDLVCRLLLEKKKLNSNHRSTISSIPYI